MICYFPPKQTDNILSNLLIQFATTWHHIDYIASLKFTFLLYFRFWKEKKLNCNTTMVHPNSFPLFLYVFSFFYVSIVDEFVLHLAVACSKWRISAHSSYSKHKCWWKAKNHVCYDLYQGYWSSFFKYCLQEGRCWHEQEVIWHLINHL